MEVDEEIENEVPTKVGKAMCPHCGQEMANEEQDTDDMDDIKDVKDFGDSIAKAVVAEMQKNNKKTYDGGSK